MGPADRRPARPDRAELGQGLDHRGQRHPRRQVLGDLDRQGGLHRAQLRDRARRQARLPVPAGVGVLGSPDRLGPRAHRIAHRSARNTIFDCGQNGIVGHLGCVFSTIEDNHIYNIAIKREFYGYEIAGIKLHAALDVTIRHNRIHDCTLGTWLDWQTQGTRVSRNLFYAQQPGPVRRGQPRPLPRRPQHLRVPGLAGVVQPRRRLRQQPRLRHRVARACAGPAHSLPHAAQHPGRRLRGDPRRRRPPRRQHLPRRRRRPGIRADGAERRQRRLRHRRLRRSPGVHGGVPRPDRRPDRAATTSASSASSSRSTSTTTSTRRSESRSRPRRTRSSSTGATSPSGRRRGRRGLPRDPTARPIRQRARRRRHRCRPANRVRFVDADFEEPDGTAVTLDMDLRGEHKDGSQTYPAGPIGSLQGGSHRTRIW